MELTKVQVNKQRNIDKYKEKKKKFYRCSFIY